MAKERRKGGEKKAKRKLAKAQLDLHIAQEKLVQARARGKQEVEQARLRAARWSTRAAQEVERSAEAVVRAEARLTQIQRNKQDRSTDPVESRTPMLVLPDEQSATGSA